MERFRTRKIPHRSSNVGLHYHGPSTHTGEITCCSSEETWWMDGWWKDGKERQPARNASRGSKLPVSAIFWWDFSLEAYTERSSGNITGLIKMIGMGRFSCQWRERELFQGNHCSDQRTIVFVWKQVQTAAGGSHVFIFNPGPVACYIYIFSQALRWLSIQPVHTGWVQRLHLLASTLSAHQSMFSDIAPVLLLFCGSAADLVST